MEATLIQWIRNFKYCRRGIYGAFFFFSAQQVRDLFKPVKHICSFRRLVISQLCHFLKYTVHRADQKILYRKIHNVNDTPLGSEVEQSKVKFCLKALYLTMPFPNCSWRKLVSLRFRVISLASLTWHITGKSAVSATNRIAMKSNHID